MSNEPIERPTGIASMQNEVLANIYARRSVRSYEQKDVPDDVLREIIKAGTYAPTAVNKQPWRFAVIKNKALLKKYSGLAKKLWAEQYSGTDDPEKAGLVRVMAQPRFDVFYGAPVLILVFASPDAYSPQYDCALAAGNMMLAARSLGIGSCWIGLAAVLGTDKSALEELGIPEGHKLMAPLIFGYPAKATTKAPPRDKEAIIKWLE
jgi:nitroreductase